ncbi:1-deoxy-D-xylulose-5-phosphate reductoisomerase [Treponema sp.]|uniref:1-deoxy-D-xylulose-5-phosphate reductoisomerase n=1 Tax=Treponema sp. TaxID=166 RepID=UPI0025D6172E|nr:1-deoxy-D-xylulose-5-phosphate reductoisomerase [Treponema sp.]MCR5218346.1 1-deoxy-D-xylulose-5-phosphate reductoisomerase [Treponema sp.]
MKKRVLVLGCTGSIGSQTLDIARHFPEKFEICGLSCGSNENALKDLCAEFNCQGSLFSKEGISGIEKLIKNTGADIAVNGIAGAAGLEPSVLVLQNKIDLALANKETVVMAWPLVKKIAEDNNARILPVDSEHSAIFNLTQKIGVKNISQIVITASGGPFRNFSRKELENVTVEQALNHPTWNMGPKITIDSASLANKGLEVIEAVRLFDFSPDKVKVVVHPQSLIHSLVRTNDGVLYAQISDPDMRHPIYGALVWPEYEETYLEPFDLADHEMTFFKPRMDDFPLLAIAYECAEKGAEYTVAFNAANEVAVHAFINKKCSFLDIAEVVRLTVNNDWSEIPDTLEKVYSADKKARECASEILKKLIRSKQA